MTDVSAPFPQAHGVADGPIRRAAVIGAGAMGGGIAAQFANAGIPVDLLDIAGTQLDRDGPARAGLARQMKTGGFIVDAAATLVRVGNTDDHMHRLAQADWIVEAVIEDLAVKRALYAGIEAHRPPDAVVSSNTSTLRRAALIANQSPGFAAHFVITHFFNPPRNMPLLEIVAGEDVSADTLDRIRGAGQSVLGKTLVDCRDTPGFIANRIGCYYIAMAVLEAEAQGLSVEEADAVIAGFGVPKTGVFGLLDLIGIDLIPLVWGELSRTLPDSDACHRHDLAQSALSQRMIGDGRLGCKSGAGFYRKADDGSRDALDLSSFTYRAQAPAPDLPGGGRDPAALIAAGGRYGDYAWTVLSNLLLYTIEVGAGIARDSASIDTAIALGYGWREGPFRQADRVGPGLIAARLADQGRPVPPLLAAAVTAGGFFHGDVPAVALDGTILTRPKGDQARRSGRAAIISSDVARVDEGEDGIACLRLTGKMGVFSPAVFDALDETLSQAGEWLKALVICGGTPRVFSAGADLALFAGLIDNPDALEAYLQRGHSSFTALRYAPIPVVSAVCGLALGGGCELALHSDAVICHAEARLGLPETRLGILPGWGGTTRLYQRALDRCGGDPQAAAGQVLDLLLPGPVAANARAAQQQGLLRVGDPVVMPVGEVDRVARDVARGLIDGYAPPARARLPVCGAEGLAAVLEAPRADHRAGRVTDHQLEIAEDLAAVLTGGATADPSTPMPEVELLALERAAVLRMAARQETRERMQVALQGQTGGFKAEFCRIPCGKLQFSTPPSFNEAQRKTPVSGCRRLSGSRPRLRMRPGNSATGQRRRRTQPPRPFPPAAPWQSFHRCRSSRPQAWFCRCSPQSTGRHRMPPRAWRR
ncbi:3-hydroxyacyl-CoA dehydrogenase/enoyl-CoA hydratase family protein [Rhodophyticola sp. CCM32]|nr:3-hydroxyacyl-CoA dehydrogenase/enoyl-CoA hydratase family protein [Rhodophyticola sp. CCM32]